MQGLNERVLDRTEQRKLRWKYVRNFFLISTKPPFNKSSLENALFAHAHFQMSVEQFIMHLMLEFKFPNSMKVDDYLRWLYLSFDHRRSNCVDWRKILLYFKVLTYFRFVRDRPIDLILLLFDVFADGDKVGKTSTDRDSIITNRACDTLFTIFKTPCITEIDIFEINSMLEPLREEVLRRNNVLMRRTLEKFLRSDKRFDRLVRVWSTKAWERILPDQRLTVLDEAQEKHLQAAEVIIARFQYKQALVVYTKNALKHCFRGWKIITVKASGARAFALARLRRRALRMLQRWQRISRRYALYRRKRVLAQVMGDYAIKARVFQRILQHNRLDRRLTRLTGSLHAFARQLTLAASHLRSFNRLHAMRSGMRRWVMQVKIIKQHEYSAAHYKHHLLRMCMVPWRIMAHAHAEEIRQEAIVRENQVALQKMLDDAELAVQEMARIEAEREARRKEVEAKEEEEARQARLEKAKIQAQKEKEREQRALLNEQSAARSQRISRELAYMRAVFNVDFEYKAREILERTKERTIAYVENPENKLAIDLKFEALKREFFANPSPETRAREKMLSSYKNILFLFIDAQLKREKIDLDDLFKRFDGALKGYLTYGEFASMIRSLNTQLSEAQISNVIRHVDADRDGYITLAECQVCMVSVEQMGVPGSAWKLYVDPAEDVICYHNFETQEKFLEYEMNDKILRGINLANVYAEAEHAAQKELKTARKDEWQMMLRNYMARRLQFMYRRWKGRQVRKRLVWRVLQREQALKTKKQRFCVDFMVRRWRGRKARTMFARQLSLTIEKVWDHASSRVFYFNHATQVSSWDAPRLLRMRCGRIELGTMYSARIAEPCVWQPVATEQSAASDGALTASWQTTEELGEDAEAPPRAQQVAFIHTQAKTVFPGKPDGFQLCSTCSTQLAVRSCKDCNTNFCFACHRNSHANPFGFLQNAKAKKSQYSNPDFVAQLYNFQHPWEVARPLSCQRCQGKEGLLAAFFCQDCNLQMCRRCFSRLHKHEMKPAHMFYHV